MVHAGARAMIYTSLYLPRWMREGIKQNDRGSSMRKYLYGGDTETIQGEPLTFQFYSEDYACDDILWITDPSRASRMLTDWCRKLPSRAQHIIYVHNLNFDMVSFFWDVKHKLVEAPSGEFDFQCHGWHVTGVYGAPTFARLSDGKRTVFLVDSYSYYRASLAKAAEVFCPGLPKLSMPPGLGKKRFKASDLDFCEYAMRDSVVAYHIGIALEALHNEFDLVQTVSVADMAARIFRHHYLEQTIPQPPRAIMECALNSYHGGKNNVSVKPGWFTGVSSLDISSAYPHAMAGFPSFYEAKLYKKYLARAPKTVPPLGVYRVRGVVSDCKWPVLFAHDFTPLRGERVEGVCVSGYELNEAIASGEFKPTNVAGWFYDEERDRHDPPLKRFVAEFYARKEAEKDKAKRAMYKFILNSISGKFIQTRKRNPQLEVGIDDGMRLNESSELIAGGMFHPFIASLITGHTRARIHKLEHEYEALHTATDGIFTRKPVTMAPQKGLGAIVNEAQGDLLMLRNKLYILYGDAKPDTPPEELSAGFEGKRIVKAALHGFAGRVQDLEGLVVTGRRKYDAKRVNRLRASLKADMTPNEFRQQAYVLKVGTLPVH